MFWDRLGNDVKYQVKYSGKLSVEQHDLASFSVMDLTQKKKITFRTDLG